MSPRTVALVCVLLAVIAAPLWAASNESQQGTPDLKTAGPLAFGPDGVLLVGDFKGAALFAIETGDTAGNPAGVNLNIADLDQQIASLLGTTKDDILVNDLAVNPLSGNVYVSVSRGRGPDALPVILRIDAEGQLAEFALDDVAFTKAELPNAPEDAVTGEGRRQRNQRLESITDIAYIDGQVFVAGLSNEEFASKLRSIPYPFEQVDEGTSIEIYHGSHGAWETRSPVRTFAAYSIDDAPYLLAAYTCTPLVKIPVALLRSEGKVTGDTVAELGNWNRPLDMVIYSQGGTDYLLMANSSRGLMKIPLADIAEIDTIKDRVPDKAGLDYETIEGADNVVQLDQLNAGHVVVLKQSDEGMSLETMPLP